MPRRLQTGDNRIATVSISRSEWCWLSAAILFGMILRLSFPSRMAIEHFDEGVYASNFWFGPEEGSEYPARHLYAPPLLPMAIEWVMIIATLLGIKPTGWIPFIPSLIAGIATIPSIWWICRRWFGPGAGLVSAWLVAASDFHASYSRAALTDVPVCLFMLWAVYFSWLALQKGTRRDLVLAGLFTGLAWWTKYNGWLPLAISLSGGAAWQLFLPRTERRVLQFIGQWLTIAAIAFVVWSPVLWSLQSKGGYAAVAANHRQYVVGLSGWKNSALRQLRIVGLYENLLEPIRTPIDEGMILYGEPQKSWFGNSLMGFSATQTLLRLMFLGQSILSQSTLPLLAIVSVTTCLVRLRLAISQVLLRTFSRVSTSPVEKRADSEDRLIEWMILAWFTGMTLVTPMYYPYPRLMFPWLFSIWIGSGLAVQMWRHRRSIPSDVSTPDDLKAWRPNRVELVMFVWVLSFGFIQLVRGGSFSLRDRSTCLVESQSIKEKIEERVK
ncbi:MAG: glycosyltransferase family 39 protein, partial [Planctomycetes bacterium]|nr:glycosyltransferase family 39 protein [Planctomycetota bacterium]